MLCEQCRERRATVHVKQVVNRDATEKHLCEECARQSGEMDFLNLTGGVNISSLLAGFMNLEQAAAPSKQKGESCQACGADYRRFAEGGRLGCAGCYQTFAKHLGPLLKRIHGTLLHNGKVPRLRAQEVTRKRQLIQLRQELKDAVGQEQYERAAELRDRIRRLETEEGGGEV
ncbi:MAG: Protein-arginine kinase activator protein [Firmicutes bacterium]|nr:Protein-arginine kinase activator protein [candidate division NPL-UPA2 bacterium]